MSAGQTVLLVEDNDDDLALATMAFSKSGWPHHLLPMRDGQEAIDYLYAIPAHAAPALIVLDLKLPRVDGKTVLREIRGNPRTTRVPVVMLTSSRLEQDVIDAYCLGANSYLIKDLDFGQFMLATRIATVYWLGLNVPPPGLAAERPPLHPLQLISAADADRLIPRRGDLTNEIVVVDGNAEDREATLRAIEASQVRNPTRGLGRFDEIVHFIRPAGGPPPLLGTRFPRLFIVDVNLEDGDGRDVLQALRYRADHHTVVVMFTRNMDPKFVSECYRIKVSSVVRKPEEPQDYRDAVRLIANYWIHMNEPPPDPSWSKRAIAHPG